jgi:flagellar motility protein MotE (MotC chaperone)
MRITIAKPRLLPLILGTCLCLTMAKTHALWRVAWPGGGLVAAAVASPAPSPVTAPPPTVAPPTQPPELDPVDAAERAILGSLRGRRAEIEAREQALTARESMLAAAERRLTTRLEEMAALQARLEVLGRGRDEREEAGWRGLVKTYEAMRPRDAAAVFDGLEMPVLVQIVDRMREAKVAPVIGAMRPDRARNLTAELAKHRASVNRPD